MNIKDFTGSGARVIEDGLLAAGSALGALQRTIGAIAGQPAPKPPTAPELKGPTSLDQATSELANRLIRLARYWATSGSGGLAGVAKDVREAARKSFAGLEFEDPWQRLALPFQIPLSFGSLLAQESLRGLHVVAMVGLKEAPRFLLDEVAEPLLDIPVYVSLQYREEISRYKQRIQEAPDDGLAHLELGRTYMKCGLHAQAIEELGVAARSPKQRPRALYESVIAHYYAGRHEEAARIGAAAMAEGVTTDRMRYWTWLASRRIGGYPAETRAEHRVEMAGGLSPTELRYVDVAAKIGIDKTSAGRGTAVFDYDNDGNLDVLISAVSGGMTLYHNNGDGTFTDVSVGSGLDTLVNSWGIAIGDYNNDGFPDVFVTRLGYYWGDPVLFRNNGDGTFTDVTKEAGINLWTPGFMASWVDTNNDGLLDLYVPGNLGGISHRKRPDCLYRNNGDGTFTEAAGAAGLRKESPTLGACWGDYDNDGFPDLFLSSPIGRPSLFHNNGDGTFTDRSREAGIGDPGFGFVAFFCDYDDDGWLDIVQLLWCPYDHAIHSLRHGRGADGGRPLRVYHNNRNGTFTDVSRDIGITESWGTMSGNGGDLNNDGYLDLVLGNGAPPMDRSEPVVVLESSKGYFRNVTFSAGLPAAGKSHGINIADLFGDGRMHIISASGGMYPGDLRTTSVWQPVALPGNYLNVRLVGTRSNRDALGARVKLTAGGRDQHRLVSGGTGFGCLPFEQHFGLGRGVTPDSLEIRWPSGLCQRFAKPPLNATIRIVEGEGSFRVVKSGRKPL